MPLLLPAPAILVLLPNLMIPRQWSLRQWKEQWPEVVEDATFDCDECNGRGTVDCPECDGMGDDITTDDQHCQNCHGTGRVYCNECDGLGWIDTGVEKDYDRQSAKDINNWIRWHEAVARSAEIRAEKP